MAAISLKELKQLRSTLIAHRLQHERLVTEMQVLRENCQMLRAELRTSRSSEDGLGDEAVAAAYHNLVT